MKCPLNGWNLLGKPKKSITALHKFTSDSDDWLHHPVAGFLRIMTLNSCPSVYGKVNIEWMWVYCYCFSKSNVLKTLNQRCIPDTNQPVMNLLCEIGRPNNLSLSFWGISGSNVWPKQWNTKLSAQAQRAKFKWDSQPIVRNGSIGHCINKNTHSPIPEIKMKINNDNLISAWE